MTGISSLSQMVTELYDITGCMPDYPLEHISGISSLSQMVTELYDITGCMPDYPLEHISGKILKNGCVRMSFNVTMLSLNDVTLLFCSSLLVCGKCIVSWDPVEYSSG